MANIMHRFYAMQSHKNILRITQPSRFNYKRTHEEKYQFFT